MIADAITGRQKRVSTQFGRFSEVTYATVPAFQDAIVNAGYRLFPEGDAGRRPRARPRTRPGGAHPRAARLRARDPRRVLVGVRFRRAVWIPPPDGRRAAATYQGSNRRPPSSNPAASTATSAPETIRASAQRRPTPACPDPGDPRRIPRPSALSLSPARIARRAARSARPCRTGRRSGRRADPPAGGETDQRAWRLTRSPSPSPRAARARARRQAAQIPPHDRGRTLGDTLDQPHRRDRRAERGGHEQGRTGSSISEAAVAGTLSMGAAGFERVTLGRRARVSRSQCPSCRFAREAVAQTSLKKGSAIDRGTTVVRSERESNH